MNEKATWQYVDQPFPELAEYNQTIRGDSSFPLSPMPSSKMLFENSEIEISSVKVTGTQSIEFWVFALVIR